MTTVSLPPKRSVLGVGVSTTSYENVVALCHQWIQARLEWSGRPGESAPAGRYICVSPVNAIMDAVWHSRIRRILNEADIVTPDGMPVVWALRSLGAKDQPRVYGPDLMLKLCEQAARHGHLVYFYGARDETLQAMRERLLARYPDLRIAGMEAPPFRALTPEEDQAATQRILESCADIVFVGLGAPKQEQWMSGHRSLFPGLILIGVGAAFDFHAGRVRQAPGWMQRSGLEWLFRLLMEPARLWKRYLVVAPLFIPLWALQWAGVLHFRDPLAPGDNPYAG